MQNKKWSIHDISIQAKMNESEKIAVIWLQTTYYIWSIHDISTQAKMNENEKIAVIWLQTTYYIWGCYPVTRWVTGSVCRTSL